MARQDVIIAMKNAIDRGYSLDQAAQSLFNAGYSQNDVSEAFNYLTSGVGNMEKYSPQDSQTSSSIQNSKAQNNTNIQEDKNEITDNSQNSEHIHEGYKSAFVSGNYSMDKQNPYSSFSQDKLKPKKSKFLSGKFIALISLLALFVLFLLLMLIFRDNLTSFLDKLTG